MRARLPLRSAPSRGPQEGDQQQHRGGPLKPDLVETAEHVDHEQEDSDGDHHDAETGQARIPTPGTRKADSAPSGARRGS